MTRTCALLGVSSACYAEIRGKLMEAGYEHAFHVDERGEAVDMHGLALQTEQHSGRPGAGEYRGPTDQLIDQLIVEGGVHDTAMTTAPWTPDCVAMRGTEGMRPDDRDGVVWLRNNLRAMLDEIDAWLAARPVVEIAMAWAIARSNRMAATDALAAVNVAQGYPEDSPERDAWRATERLELELADKLYEACKVRT